MMLEKCNSRRHNPNRSRNLTFSIAPKPTHIFESSEFKPKNAILFDLQLLLLSLLPCVVIFLIIPPFAKQLFVRETILLLRHSLFVVLWRFFHLQNGGSWFFIHGGSSKRFLEKWCKKNPRLVQCVRAQTTYKHTCTRRKKEREKYTHKHTHHRNDYLIFIKCGAHFAYGICSPR